MSSLRRGDEAPDFELRDQRGDTVRLSDYQGRKLLLYFYPAAGSVDCRAQSCNVRDHRQEFAGLGIDVVGISPDPQGVQRAFDDKHGLGFPLLSDEDHAVADVYGTWGEYVYQGELVTGVIRSSFLIAEDGRIESVWSPVEAEATVALALNVLDRRADTGSTPS